MTDYGRIMREIEAKQEDVVNNPKHYNQAGIECIDAIEACSQQKSYEATTKENILKYTWREQYKNKDEDLRKAHWYLTRLLTKLGVKL